MPRTPGDRNNLLAQVGFYSSLGIIVPAGALAGAGLGWVLDRGLHTSPIFALVLGLVGAAAGLVEILRILTRAEKKQDDANKPNDGSGAS